MLCGVALTISGFCAKMHNIKYDNFYKDRSDFMSFSELSKIQSETGLKFVDYEKSAVLSGIKNNIPVCVVENFQMEQIVIFCGVDVGKAFDLQQHQKLSAEINKLSDSFPKNTITRIEATPFITVFCKSFNLIQENLPRLIEFLEKLTLFVENCGFETKLLDEKNCIYLAAEKPVVKKQAKAKKPKKAKEKINVNGTIKGAVGGLIGMIITGAIWIAALNIAPLYGWVGGALLPLGIIILYTKFSKKMQIIDTFISAIEIIIGAVGSNFIWALLQIFGNEREFGKITVFDILANSSHYFEKYYLIMNDFQNNLLVGSVFVLFAAGAGYAVYYNAHEKEMY